MKRVPIGRVIIAAALAAPTVAGQQQISLTLREGTSMAAALSRMAAG